jgi:hypothetical protein
MPKTPDYFADADDDGNQRKRAKQWQSAGRRHFLELTLKLIRAVF